MCWIWYYRAFRIENPYNIACWDCNYSQAHDRWFPTTARKSLYPTGRGKGALAKIRFDYNDKSITLTINKRVGSFSGMLENRTFNFVYVTKQNATSFDLKNKQEVEKGVVTYKGKKISVKL